MEQLKRDVRAIQEAIEEQRSEVVRFRSLRQARSDELVQLEKGFGWRERWLGGRLGGDRPAVLKAKVLRAALDTYAGQISGLIDVIDGLKGRIAALVDDWLCRHDGNYERLARCGGCLRGIIRACDDFVLTTETVAVRLEQERQAVCAPYCEYGMTPTYAAINAGPYLDWVSTALRASGDSALVLARCLREYASSDRTGAGTGSEQPLPGLDAAAKADRLERFAIAERLDISEVFAMEDAVRAWRDEAETACAVADGAAGAFVGSVLESCLQD